MMDIFPLFRSYHNFLPSPIDRQWEDLEALCFSCELVRFYYSVGCEYGQVLLTGETPPDGKVEAGSLLRGQLVYEVPTSQKTFTFNFEADIVAGGQTVWDLHM